MRRLPAMRASNEISEIRPQMGNKHPSDLELSKIVEEAQEMGSYRTLDSPEFKIKAETERQPSQLKTGGKSLGGGYDLILVRDHTLLNEQTNRRLETAFYGSEWSALFFDVLGCPKPRPYLPEDDIDAWMEKRKLNFQLAIPDYPLLARMVDPYSDVWYLPQEVPDLRSECVTITARTKDPTALEGLHKLIFACDKSLETGLGLFLVSD